MCSAVTPPDICPPAAAAAAAIAAAGVVRNPPWGLMLGLRAYGLPSQELGLEAEAAAPSPGTLFPSSALFRWCCTACTPPNPLSRPTGDSRAEDRASTSSLCASACASAVLMLTLRRKGLPCERAGGKPEGGLGVQLAGLGME